MATWGSGVGGQMRPTYPRTLCYIRIMSAVIQVGKSRRFRWLEKHLLARRKLKQWNECDTGSFKLENWDWRFFIIVKFVQPYIHGTTKHTHLLHRCILEIFLSLDFRDSTHHRPRRCQYTTTTTNNMLLLANDLTVTLRNITEVWKNNDQT